MEKVFRSMDEYKRYYFPKAYAKEQKEKRIKEVGIMGYLLEQLSKELATKREQSKR